MAYRKLHLKSPITFGIIFASYLYTKPILYKTPAQGIVGADVIPYCLSQQRSPSGSPTTPQLKAPPLTSHPILMGMSLVCWSLGRKVVMMQYMYI